MSTSRDGWSGRAGFILATIGSAVGLGSIWKFPYEVGSNGGGAFILFYVAGLVFIVVPLMFAEFAIGRRGRGDPATCLRVIAAAEGRSRLWVLPGALGAITGFLILSFYGVIGGWTIGYLVETLRDGLPGTDPAAVQRRFSAFLASPGRLATYQAVFMMASAVIVARGIAGGIESASKVLMPILGVLMILLAGYGLVEGDVRATLNFLFRVETEHLTARAALDALGLGFFSIGVGLGLMITYAAYSGTEIGLKQVAIVSVAGDTVISMLSGLAVFPIVFAHGLDPAGGPGLVFVTLPLAFADMPFGLVAAASFYTLLFVAALLSSVSMLELCVAMLMRWYGWSRRATSAIVTGACSLAGLGTVLSFNRWAGWHPLGDLAAFGDATLFDLLDQLTSNVLLPVCGFALSLFAGWFASDALLADELKLSKTGAALLRGLLRFVVPAAIALVAAWPHLGR
ncbi:MAG: sodium-dependent transporter [Burkholderiales bacterium]